MDWDQLRALVNLAAAKDSNWAGAPMPVRGIPLRVEPRYPYAGLDGFCFDGGPGPADDGPEIRVRNSWYSHQRSAMVHVCEDDAGIFPVVLPEYGGSRLAYWLTTMGASEAWSVEAEKRAVGRLGDLISERAHRFYGLAGCFLESSRRSGVQYLFRRLRPTVALRPGRDGGMRVLAVLCLHPIGFYQGSWAGAMVPTDDVIAHLLLMRACEAKFWAKANHHPVWAASAGL